MTTTDGRDHAGREPVTVGIAADPGPSTEIAQQLAVELSRTLSHRDDDRAVWEVDVRSEELDLDADGRILVTEKAQTVMPAEGWDFLICLTDLPRQEGSSPIVAEVDAAERAALVSLPALGGVRLRARVRETLVHVVDIMAGRTPDHDGIIRTGLLSRVFRRPWLPARRASAAQDEVNLWFGLHGIRGRIRLLCGMVRDNRPWRLVPSLSRAIAAAAGTATFGIFYPTVWSLADALSPLRLSLISLFATVTMVGWLTVHNDLWERTRNRESRAQTALYNLASVLTLFVGVACMYAVLFTFALLAAAAVISSDYLESILRHPAGLADYVGLVWLSSSLGTLAGALGSSLESEDAIRRAAYSKREQQRRARRRHDRERFGTEATLG